jgi:SAM-dependent methyltransferase
MSELPHDAEELSRIYASRFEGQERYRLAVWRILIETVFSRWIRPDQTVLDLGAGQGEFINQIRAARKYAIDLNPESRRSLDPAVEFFEQDCSSQWPIGEGSLDLVFTSNFFEHLPDKLSLRRTLEQAFRGLRSGGHLIAMGPNIRVVPGAYWDFWDHYLPLTERSLGELARLTGFVIEQEFGKTLPYSMSQGLRPPLWCVRLYCMLPCVWPLVGKQFIVVLRKP